MDIQYLGEIGDFHFRKRLVAQNAGIGAQEIDAAHSLVARSTMAVTCSKLETSAPSAIAVPPVCEFRPPRLRPASAIPGAVACAAEFIDHDLGAAAGQPQRMRPSQTIARAGDDSDASSNLIAMRGSSPNVVSTRH